MSAFIYFFLGAVVSLALYVRGMRNSARTSRTIKVIEEMLNRIHVRLAYGLAQTISDTGLPLEGLPEDERKKYEIYHCHMSAIEVEKGANIEDRMKRLKPILEKWMALDPANPELLWRHAKLLVYEGPPRDSDGEERNRRLQRDHDKLIEDLFERASKLAPHNNAVVYEKAAYYAETRRHLDEAIETLQRRVESGPETDDGFSYSLAYLLYRRNADGDNEQARKHIDRFIQSNPRHWTARWLRAWIYDRLGDTDQAALDRQCARVLNGKWRYCLGKWGARTMVIGFAALALFLILNWIFSLEETIPLSVVGPSLFLWFAWMYVALALWSFGMPESEGSAFDEDRDVGMRPYPPGPVYRFGESPFGFAWLEGLIKPEYFGFRDAVREIAR